MPKNLTQAEWDAIEKEFLKNMNDRYFQDIRNDIQTLRKNRPESIKSQLCLAFTLADSLSRIHKIFSGVRGENLDKDNEDRFRAWMDAFVLTEKNDEYKKYKGLIAPNSKVLWNIRNSFLHFYSFPPVKEGQDYVIFGYNLSVETNSNVKKAFQEKGYKAVIGFTLYAPENYVPLVAKGRTMENNPKPQNLQQFKQFIGLLDKIFGDKAKVIPGIRVGFLSGLLPEFNRKRSQVAMGTLLVEQKDCTRCGLCAKICAYQAITLNPYPTFDSQKCYGCWACYNRCPTKVIYTKKFKNTAHYPRPLAQYVEKLDKINQ